MAEATSSATSDSELDSASRASQEQPEQCGCDSGRKTPDAKQSPNADTIPGKDTDTIPPRIKGFGIRINVSLRLPDHEEIAAQGFDDPGEASRVKLHTLPLTPFDFLGNRRGTDTDNRLFSLQSRRRASNGKTGLGITAMTLAPCKSCEIYHFKDKCKIFCYKCGKQCQFNDIAQFKGIDCDKHLLATQEETSAARIHIQDAVPPVILYDSRIYVQVAAPPIPLRHQDRLGLTSVYKKATVESEAQAAHKGKSESKERAATKKNNHKAEVSNAMKDNVDPEEDYAARNIALMAQIEKSRAEWKEELAQKMVEADELVHRSFENKQAIFVMLRDLRLSLERDATEAAVEEDS